MELSQPAMGIPIRATATPFHPQPTPTIGTGSYRQYTEQERKTVKLLENVKSLQVVEKVKPGTRAVFCVWCANAMSVEMLTEGIFQMTCSSCGTSGPRRNSTEQAIEATRDIFNEQA